MTGNFETDDKRDVLGIIAIRVGDLLISGSDLPIWVYFGKMKVDSGLFAMVGDQSTYLGVKIKKVGDSDFVGLVLDPNDYKDKII